MTHLPIQLETNRLICRCPRIEDADKIFAAYAQDPEVTKYLIWKPYTNKQDLEKWLSDRIKDFASNKENCYVLCPREDNNNVIGMVSIVIYSHVAHVGCVLAKEHWRKGLMTEVLSYLVDWALEQKYIFRVWQYVTLIT